MSYHNTGTRTSFVGRQRSWKDVLPPSSAPKKQYDKPPLVPLPKKKARILEEADKREDRKERVRRQEELKKYKKERSRAKKCAVLQARIDVEVAYLEMLTGKITNAGFAAVVSRLQEIRCSCPLTTDLY